MPEGGSSVQEFRALAHGMLTGEAKVKTRTDACASEDPRLVGLHGCTTCFGLGRCGTEPSSSRAAVEQLQASFSVSTGSC
jgi:hypothetical protein